MDGKRYFLPENVYQVLKWVGLVLMPALATLVAAVGGAWGFEPVEPVVATINAIGLFIGALIGYSQLTAKGDE
jgi:hypothetical protein